jgi:hypothetical protein
MAPKAGFTSAQGWVKSTLVILKMALKKNEYVLHLLEEITLCF